MNVGVREPRVVATELAGPRQRVTRQVQENTGRLLKAGVARLSNERLLVELTFEESYMEPMEQSEGEESVDSVRIVTFSYDSMVACPDGKVLCVLASTMREPGEGDQQIVILVSARVVEPRVGIGGFVGGGMSGECLPETVTPVVAIPPISHHPPISFPNRFSTTRARLERSSYREYKKSLGKIAQALD